MNAFLSFPVLPLDDASEYIAASLVLGLFPMIYFWLGAIGFLSIVYDQITLRGLGLCFLAIAMVLVWMVLLISVVQRGAFPHRDEFLLLGLCGGLCIAAWRISKV
jgi:hypothetical protein